jgi:hypothetical protein
MREAALERAGVIGDLQRVAADEASAARQPGDPARCWIMGTGRTIGPAGSNCAASRAAS